MATEKKPEYSPGLAGVIAGETAICWVDPNAGLMYRGYDIHEMGDKATFEEVAYLLLNGELPNGKQLKDFKQQIAAQRDLPKEVVEMLRLLPKSTHPMDMLRTGVSMLSAFDKDLSDNSHDANIRKSIRLIARVSTLITDGWRILQGENHGIWTPGLQKRRFTRADHAQDRARSRQAHRKRELGAHLRKARRGDGPRERSVREC